MVDMAGEWVPMRKLFRWRVVYRAGELDGRAIEG